MGFDMEVCVEVLEGGEWRQVGALFTEDELAMEYWPIRQKRPRPLIWRNYDFFRWFGFRVGPDDEVIDRARGLPADVTVQTAIDWEEWGHRSMTTWFTFDELNGFLMRRPAVAESARQTGFMDVMDTMRDYRKRASIDDVRAIIWIAA